jgi:hypothetical protein
MNEDLQITKKLREVGEQPEAAVGASTSLATIERRAAAATRRSQQRVRIALSLALVALGVGGFAAVRSSPPISVVASPSQLKRAAFVTSGDPRWTTSTEGNVFDAKPGSSGVLRLERDSSERGTSALTTTVSLDVPWPLPKDAAHEIILTTAKTPSGQRRDSLFGVEAFGGHASLGCRLLSDASVTCASFDASDGLQVGGGRLAQWSWFEKSASTVTAKPGSNSIVGCSSTKPRCRIEFRLYVEPTSLELRLNQSPAILVTNIPVALQPVALAQANVFVGIVARDAPLRSVVLG